MPLFGKKKKGESKEAELEVMDRAENDKAEVSVKKKGAFSNFKKKVRVILKFERKKKGTSGEDDSERGASRGSESDGGDDKKGKAKKPKKEKKEKKPKEQKKKKPKKSGDSKDGEGGEDNKKIKPIVWIIIAVGALAVGAAAFLIVTLINRPTVEEQLLSAQQLFNEQKYADADAIYDKLLKKDQTLVAAHIGHADILVATEQLDAALESLNAALEPTSNDPQIHAKIDELTPPPEEPPGEESTASFAVSFSDPEFEKMIRLALNKSSSEQIMNDELATVTSLKIMGGTHASAVINGRADDDHKNIQSINRIDGYTIDGIEYTERGAIKNLNDLKYFTSLKKLVVAYNAVTDISGVSGLEKLDTVGLYCNDISDVKPLSSLTTLEYLYIYNNRISDISPLSSLTGLKQLWLNKNNIADISPLKNLTELTELFLNSNEIKDISAVASLKKLGFLYFDDNQVTDISAVKDLTALTDISFVNNPIEDKSPASRIKNINRSYF